MTSSIRRPVALVTGGRRGIGRGIACALADGGFDLVINDLEPDAAAEETLALLRERGAQAAFAAGDIADLEDHARLVEAAFDAFGTLDCLVNNAGVTVRVRGDMLEVGVDSYDRVMDINLRGTFFLTQAVARRMVAEQRAAGAPARSIITISSFNAAGASIDRSEYCISKAGLAMMTKLFALRLAPEGINVFEVRPGIIRTDMTAVAKEKYDRLIGGGLTPIARWGEPEDIGRAVAALASGAFGFCVGEAIHVDGGLHVLKL